jgi:hypothetical protein
MDMTISLPDEVALKLKERAAGSGETLSVYTAKLIAETLTKPTIDELLEPVRSDFAKAGLTDDQLMDFGREQLAAVRREKKAKSA